MVSTEDKVTYNDIVKVIHEKRYDIGQYIYRFFSTSNEATKRKLLAKHGCYQSFKEEVIQRTTCEMLEGVNRLGKSYLKYSLFNYLKNVLRVEIYAGKEIKKEVYDFPVTNEDDGSSLSFLDVVIDEDDYIKQEGLENNEMIDSILSNLNRVKLSEQELKIIDFMFFQEREEEPTHNDLADYLGKKQKTVSEAYNKAINKIREYFFIDYYEEIKTLIPIKKSVSRKTNLTKEELLFIVDNYKFLTRKEIVKHLSKGRHKEINENYLKIVARKLGLTDSNKEDAGTKTIEDFLKEPSLSFTYREDNIIMRNVHCKNKEGLLAFLNLLRSDPITMEELNLRMQYLNKMN